MERTQVLWLILSGVVLWVGGFWVGGAIFDRPHCHPTKPPVMTKMKCEIQEGHDVSLFACENQSVNEFGRCLEQMEDWATTTYEGCK